MLLTIVLQANDDGVLKDFLLDSLYNKRRVMGCDVISVHHGDTTMEIVSESDELDIL